MKPKYDIALSFAGEDRDYVEEVAKILISSGVKVFYDTYEEATLWGKNLYDHLNKTYQEDSLFTVIFISKFYAKKIWTNLERQSAQARAFRENTEYILPARFDDTEIPGIPPTIGYIDLRKKTVVDFSKLILTKINQKSIKHINKDRHYLLDSCEAEPNDIVFDLKMTHEFSKIAIKPSMYLRVGDLLDDLFSYYLLEYCSPFSYGKDWVIEGYFPNKRLIVPWQWALKPYHTVFEMSPDWYDLSLEEAGINYNSWGVVPIKNDPFRDISGFYFLGTNSQDLWNLVNSKSKAIYLLQSKGFIDSVNLDESIATMFKFHGVFRDWLRIGSQCAWVHNGKPVPNDLKELFFN